MLGDKIDLALYSMTTRVRKLESKDPEKDLKVR
jgi:hypothetical protein